MNGLIPDDVLEWIKTQPNSDELTREYIEIFEREVQAEIDKEIIEAIKKGIETCA